MKHTRKFLAIFMVIAMIMSMGVLSAFADETYTLTVTGNAGHTYEVYQIFTGDLSGDVLSNIVWGNGVTEAGQTAIGDAADKAENLTSANIGDFEALVDDYLTNPTTMTAGTADETTGKVTYTVAGLEPGYYLVKDKDGSQDDESGAYTAYILKIVKNTSANAKDSVPTSDKSIVEGTDRVNASDKNIGDTVTFELKVTLGDLKEYETYKLVFKDTMSAGLTFKEYTGVTIGGETASKDAFSMTQEGQNLTFTCTDVIAQGAKSGSVIVITYTATLNSSAEIGTPGNKNEFYVEYSNNPNPGGEGTGTTPKDEVLVFTYELDTTKIAGEDTTMKLPDAEFVLYRTVDDKSEYVLIDGNGKVTGWTETKPETGNLKSDENGLFKVIGLDAGTYYLEETKAPAGYNLLDAPVPVVITATLNTAEDQADLTKLEISVNNETAVPGDTETGIVNAQITNNKGATLPETGGMGTVLFVAIGSLLALAAALFLVTKKRMSNAQY